MTFRRNAETGWLAVSEEAKKKRKKKQALRTTSSKMRLLPDCEHDTRVAPETTKNRPTAQLTLASSFYKKQEVLLRHHFGQDATTRSLN